MFLLGPLLVLIFTLSQSVRDVYFGQRVPALGFFPGHPVGILLVDGNFRRP